MRSIALLRLAALLALATFAALPASRSRTSPPIPSPTPPAKPRTAKKRPAAKKVYTNDDIPPRPSLPLPSRQALRRRLASRDTDTSARALTMTRSRTRKPIGTNASRRLATMC